MQQQFYTSQENPCYFRGYVGLNAFMKLLIWGWGFLYLEIGAHTKAVTDSICLFSGESNASEFSLK